MDHYGAPEVIQCDNGTEFKDEVQCLAAEKRIKMIHSQAYMPQTNELVEKGNGIAKVKVVSWKDSTGCIDWANGFSQIAHAMNLSPCRLHPSNLTSYIVFFENRADFPVPSSDRINTTDSNNQNAVVPFIEAARSNTEEQEQGQAGQLD